MQLAHQYAQAQEREREQQARRRLPILHDTRIPGVVYLSPSQIDTYNDCKRKWAWQYIAKIRSPPNASARLGTLVHAYLEMWLDKAIPPGSEPPRDRDGRPLQDSKANHAKAVQIAQRMIRHLPPPGTGTVERNFYFRTQRGHHYTGFIDWSGLMRHELLHWVARDSVTGQDIFETRAVTLPTINDHKTTGNLEYAKTEEQLHTDVQGVLYAIAGFLGFGVDELLLFWDYGTTKDRDAQTRPVKTRVHLENVLLKFENVIEVVAAEILEHHRNQQHPMSFPATVSACSAFGGCPHRDRCNISDQERLRATMNDGQTPNMAERMAAYPSNGAPQPQFAPPQQMSVQFPPAAPQFSPQQTFVPPVPEQQTQFAPPSGQTAAPMPMMPPGGIPAAPAGYLQPPQQAFQPPQPHQPGTAPQQYGHPQPHTPAFQPPQNPAQPLPQAPQAPQQAYAPHIAPNPPESGQQTAPREAAGAASAGEEGGKKGRGKGRPAGSKNKELGLEGEIFMSGVYARLGNPTCGSNVDELMFAGDLAVQAYKKKFG